MERIAALLTEKGVSVAGAVVSDPTAPRAYFVPLRITHRADGRRFPSDRALAAARAGLAELGYVVDFILIDDDLRGVEESLRASLLKSFPNEVRSSFYSSGEGRPHVWVEFKEPPDAETKRRVREHLDNFAALFSLPSLSMSTVGEAGAATQFEVLSAVRQLAPVDVPTLARKLAADGHDVPSVVWLNRRLDALRKRNLLLRRRDGAYVLTTEALVRLGTRKGRQSPDIRRLLAVARRG